MCEKPPSASDRHVVEFVSGRRDNLGVEPLSAF